MKRGENIQFQKTMKALNDATRRQILELLKEERLNAGEITSHFKMSNATISHHLSILKDADLVCDEKDGKYVYYDINTKVLDDVILWFKNLKEKK